MFIDPMGKAFAHLGRLAYWQSGGKPSPVTVEWDLTNVCSRKCYACHFAHTHMGGPWAAARAVPQGYSDTGRVADLHLVTRALSQMADAGVLSVIWTGGGEPTLHPHFAAIVEAAYAEGFAQGLYTVGGHISPATATACRRLTWAVVSLDAETPEAYRAEKGMDGFAAAVDGVRALVDVCPVVGVSFLLDAQNYRRVDAMLALSRSLGATYTTFRPTIVTDPDQPSRITGDRAWLAEMAPLAARLAQEPDVEIDPERFQQYRRWAGHPYRTCYGIRVSSVVTPDGRMWACVNRRGFADSLLGDLRAESFGDIWARHPGQWTVDAQCRAMCRLHPVNETLAYVFASRPHEVFL